MASWCRYVNGQLSITFTLPVSARGAGQHCAVVSSTREERSRTCPLSVSTLSMSSDARGRRQSAVLVDVYSPLKTRG